MNEHPANRYLAEVVHVKSRMYGLIDLMQRGRVSKVVIIQALKEIVGEME